MSAFSWVGMVMAALEKSSEVAAASRILPVEILICVLFIN
jgi:hypothetical protein